MARSCGQVSYVASMFPRAIFMMVLCLFAASDVVHGRSPTKYRVGGYDIGWDVIIPQDSWASGKTFYAGDILEFKYDSQASNMVVVNRTGYETCTANEGSTTYTSGFDTIHLPYGYSYYIGTLYPGDCQAGEKLAIKALHANKLANWLHN